MNKSIFENKRNVVLLAIFYTFLWGSAFPLVKLCMDSFGAENNATKCLVAGVRFLLSGLGLLVFCAFSSTEDLKINREQVKYTFLYAMLGVFAQYGLTYIALSNMDGAKGAVFDQLCVFIVILFSGLFFRSDRLNIAKALGCAVGFFGILAINTDSLSFSFSFKAEGVMILASVFQALVYFLCKASCGRISGYKMIGYGQLFGGIMLIIFSSLFGARINGVKLVGVASLIALSLISAVAYVLSLIPLKYYPASEISVFNLLITVFGVVMSALILGENIFRWNYIVSIILISIGIILVNRKSKRERI